MRKVFPQLDRREQRIIFRIQTFIQNTAKGGGIKNTAEREGERVYLELSLDHTVPVIQYLTFINHLRYLEMRVNEQNMKFENVFFAFSLLHSLEK